MCDYFRSKRLGTNKRPPTTSKNNRTLLGTNLEDIYFFKIKIHVIKYSTKQRKLENSVQKNY